jgi:hypothetical protein
MQVFKNNQGDRMKSRLLLFLALTCMALFVPSLVIAGSEYKKEYKMSVVVGPKLPWGGRCH